MAEEIEYTVSRIVTVEYKIARSCLGEDDNGANWGCVEHVCTISDADMALDIAKRLAERDGATVHISNLQCSEVA